MELGKHAVFIWSSYAAVVVILVAIAFWLWLDGRHHKTALADLERRGIKRQSPQQKE